MGFRLALSITLLLTSLFSSSLSAAQKTNVLFIICDDLNCDLKCYNHPLVQSPNIDRLAKRGMRFERAYCQYPLCGPSRASFMTGMYPDQTLIHRNAIRIRERLPNVLTMTQLFQKHGYDTTRIGKIYHYNVPADIGKDGHDDPSSWNRTFNPRGRDKDDEPLIFSLQPGRFGGTLSWLAADGTDDEQTDAIAAKHAIEMLQEYKKSEKPFFLAVGLYRPHTPYVAPKKYFDLYPLSSIQVPTVPDEYLKTLPLPARQSLTRKKEQVDLDPLLARQAIQAYYASNTFADAQIGRILDELERLELDKNTVVLFTSDHGYHMGEHNYYQKTTLFENATRVPLIIAAPEGKSGTEKEPVEMVDFYPTLAELCGLPVPSHVQGKSLASVVRTGEPLETRAALTQYATGYSLRTNRFRYTEWGPKGSNGRELYDHTTDPHEMNNLAGNPTWVPTIDKLSAQLQRRVTAIQQAPEGIEQVRPKPRNRKKKS